MLAGQLDRAEMVLSFALLRRPLSGAGTGRSPALVADSTREHGRPPGLAGGDPYSRSRGDGEPPRMMLQATAHMLTGDSVVVMGQDGGSDAPLLVMHGRVAAQPTTYVVPGWARGSVRHGRYEGAVATALDNFQRARPVGRDPPGIVPGVAPGIVPRPVRRRTGTRVVVRDVAYAQRARLLQGMARYVHRSNTAGDAYHAALIKTGLPPALVVRVLKFLELRVDDLAGPLMYCMRCREHWNLAALIDHVSNSRLHIDAVATQS